MYFELGLQIIKDHITATTSCNFKDIMFISCKNIDPGGAIYFDLDNLNLSINFSLFECCESSQQGGGFCVRACHTVLVNSRAWICHSCRYI